MFAAYVDTMPLKWNLHFFPESFYCNGIYRVLKDYDFIGYMDLSFYNSLNSLGKRYGGRFEEKISDVFDLAKNIEKSATSNMGIETKAPTQIKAYYSPRSLRKVFEYVSFDYELLGLQIPDWAEEMLQTDPER